jgi:hypothetical protein
MRQVLQQFIGAGMPATSVILPPRDLPKKETAESRSSDDEERLLREKYKKESQSNMWSGGGCIDDDAFQDHRGWAGGARSSSSSSSSSYSGTKNKDDDVANKGGATTSDCSPPSARRFALKLPLPDIHLPATLYAYSSDMSVRWLLQWERHEPATKRDTFSVLGHQRFELAHEHEQHHLDGESDKKAEPAAMVSPALQKRINKQEDGGPVKLHSLTEANALLFGLPRQRGSECFFTPQWMWLATHLPVQSMSSDWTEALSCESLAFVASPVILSASVILSS